MMDANFAAHFAADWISAWNRHDLDEDAMIAAVAKTNGLTGVTRDLADFRSFGIELLDPFAFSPKG